jgi:deaminated glutathione amidase
MSKVFTAAVIQLRSGTHVAKNIDYAAGLIREAAIQGASYIQTPEMSSIVDRNKSNLLSQVGFEENDIFLAAMRELAKELSVTLHIGSLALRQGDKLVNRAFIIDKTGQISAKYDKIHLYDVDLPNGESWRESKSYSAGSKAVLASTDQAKIGLSICYDLRFPMLYQALAKAGAQILTAPACFTQLTGEAHWHVLQRARAIETGSFMISAAQIGVHEDGRQTYGHSMIIDPWGRVLVDAGGQNPRIALAEIDLGLVVNARQMIPVLQNTQDFQIKLDF